MQQMIATLERQNSIMKFRLLNNINQAITYQQSKGTHAQGSPSYVTDVQYTTNSGTTATSANPPLYNGYNTNPLYMPPPPSYLLSPMNEVKLHPTTIQTHSPHTHSPHTPHISGSGSVSSATSSSSSASYFSSTSATSATSSSESKL